MSGQFCFPCRSHLTGSSWNFLFNQASSTCVTLTPSQDPCSSSEGNHWPRFTGCWGTALSILTPQPLAGKLRSQLLRLVRILGLPLPRRLVHCSVPQHCLSCGKQTWACRDPGGACRLSPGNAGSGGDSGDRNGAPVGGGSPGVFSKCPGQKETGWLRWA